MKRGFWADLLCGIGNSYWDLARILSGLAFVGVNLLALYMIWDGRGPTLNEYAEAALKVLTGCAIFIGGKDAARAFATKKSEGGEQP